jgi:hypothetical protein
LDEFWKDHAVNESEYENAKALYEQSDNDSGAASCKLLKDEQRQHKGGQACSAMH